MRKDYAFWSASRSTHSKNNLKRKVMRAIRAMNKNIEDDEKWLGRFKIRARAFQHFTYEDGSANRCAVVFDIIDTKTGITQICCLPDHAFLSPYSFDFWNVVNDFVNDQTMGE